jgi:hypothetical protein
LSESAQQELQVVAEDIARQLGEKARKPKRQIFLIVKRCGVEFAQKLLEDTKEIESNGGMMTQDGKRRRTPGGVFFHLARQRIPPEIRQEIFYSWRIESQQRIEREAQFEPFDYTERDTVIPGLLEDRGKVQDVKVTMVGRPGKIERRQNLVIFTMQDSVKEETALPRGVPHPDPSPVDYTVYISANQWERVEEAIENPQDELMIDGVCRFDAETNMMAVFATYVTTRRLKKKEKKQAKQVATPPSKAEGKEDKNAKKATGQATKAESPKKRDRDEAPPAPPEPEIKIDLPSGIPDDDAEKLISLHKAAATFREKIAALEAKPEDQQFGLEMTQRLLKNTEAQIAKIEAQYTKNVHDA